MLVTEEEAKKLWCPHTRVVYEQWKDGEVSLLAAVNRVFEGTATVSPCIASQCMAWRWVRRDIARDHKPGHGYCGLAGRPES